MGTAEVISWNMAWRHKCKIACFNNLEVKDPRRIYSLPGMARS